MTTLLEIFQGIQGLTASLNKFNIGFTRAGGNLTAISSLSSGAFIQVLPANPNRNSVTFHNPAPGSSGPSVLVGPLVQGPNSSAAFLPNPNQSNLGGLFEVIPGDWVTLAGGVTQGWQASVTAGSSQALTIFDQ